MRLASLTTLEVTWDSKTTPDQRDFWESEENCLCPKCGAGIEQKKCWRDVFADRELEQLEVFCPCRKKGCQWIGYRQSVEEHLKECESVMLSCTNVGCYAEIARSDLDNHVKTLCEYRSIECPHCGANYTLIDEAHQEVCLKYPIPCPNQCNNDLRIPRDKMDDHVAACANRKSDCVIAGCPFNGSEKEVADHMTSHVVDHVSDLSKEVKSTRSALDDLDSHVKETVQDQSHSIQANKEAVNQLEERLVNAENKVTDLAANQRLMQHKTLEACYQSVDNVEKEYQSKVAGIDQHLRLLTEKCIRFEEIAVMQAESIRRLEEELARYKNYGGCSQSVEQQFDAQGRVMATHDVKLAEHGLRLDMMDCKNTNGVLLWKITDIRRRRRDAVSGKTPSIYSQPFYTSPCGYKMCARMYLNGDGMGRGTHLSLFFVIMRGEYDCLLSWPFTQKVTLILVDQDGRDHISDTFRPDPTSSSFQRPRRDMNVASGCPLFVPLGTLDTRGYIRDDAMFIKIVVDSADISRPDAR
ncbi:TNF receptor-associated factor 3-like isoform X2 [Corticium candelabrum]|uniref:TNF receptor-associated factor 3-like isoform X2 n=1 Tax=Corticium candelabrum TaxID=121492 RepID=UPI002E2533A2|nr:TNF receptor-associated factor 3-like isoform X2 [Corticium candelabrum]